MVLGANGVIIVTTKRGRSELFSLNFRQIYLLRHLILPSYLDAYETLLLRNVASKNDQKWDFIVRMMNSKSIRINQSPTISCFDWMDFYFKPL